MRLIYKSLLFLGIFPFIFFLICVIGNFSNRSFGIASNSISAGTTSNKPLLLDNTTTIRDETIIPQNDSIIIELLKENKIDLANNKSYENFTQNIFLPWDQSPFTPLEIVKNIFEEAQKNFLYGPNYIRYSPGFVKQDLENAKLEDYGKINKAGIIIRNTRLRGVPSDREYYKDHNLAGKGPPFDIMRYDYSYINTPVWISHFSKDGAWVLVETSGYVFGWVKACDIAYIDEASKKWVRSLEPAVIIKDNLPLVNSTSRTIEVAKIGTVLYHEQNSNKYYVATKESNKEGEERASFTEVTVKPQHIVTKSSPLSLSGFINLFSQLISQPYGWGGLSGDRDCSALTKDFFATFFIWLPRNSSMQANKSNYLPNKVTGNYISLQGLSAEEKKHKILTQGKPFRTLLYSPGHVVIYIGCINNDQAGAAIEGVKEIIKEPLIFHSAWGVKIFDGQNQGKVIVGKSLISRLEYGKELKYYDKDKNFFNNLDGMMILN